MILNKSILIVGNVPVKKVNYMLIYETKVMTSEDTLSKSLGREVENQ
jgi:hypothetical protein